MWVIHSRATWTHHLDICRATDRTFERTSGHDHRIAVLVIRDVAKTLAKKLGGRAAVFDLSGLAGGLSHVLRKGNLTQGRYFLALPV